MIATIAVSTLAIVLLAIIWRQHERIARLRIDAQTANDWSDYWQAKAASTEHELDALQRSYANVHALDCALVRRRLQETSHLVERNLHRN